MFWHIPEMCKNIYNIDSVKQPKLFYNSGKQPKLVHNSVKYPKLMQNTVKIFLITI